MSAGVDVDRPWREYDIHDSDEDVDPQQQNTAFDLFRQEEPLETVDFTFPSLPELLIPLRCQEDYTQSTGMAIWLGAEVLAQFLVDHPDLVRDQKVLELGAGCGLAGITAFHLKAARVVLTDGDLDALNNLRYNVEHNDSRNKVCVCHQLVWGKNLDHFQDTYGQQDVILGADIFYITRSLRPLLRTVDHLLTRNGIFIASSKAANQNSFEESVVELAADFGLTCTAENDNIYIFRREQKDNEEDEKKDNE